MKFMEMRGIFKEWEKLRGGHPHLGEEKTFSRWLRVISHRLGRDVYLSSVIILWRKFATFSHPDVPVWNCSTTFIWILIRYELFAHLPQLFQSSYILMDWEDLFRGPSIVYSTRKWKVSSRVTFSAVCVSKIWCEVIIHFS